MTEKLPEAVQQQLAQFQQLQQQAQVFAQQLSQLELAERETERTLAELEQITPETPVYRATGAVMIKVADLAALKTELGEERETLTLRAKTVNRQTDIVAEQLKELQQKLTPLLQKGSGGA